MKKRIAKKQQQRKQREQEQLQAAWELITDTLHKQYESYLFFVNRELVSSEFIKGWQYTLYNHHFKLHGTKVYPLRTEVHK
ncbi:hypothetical protein M5X02_24025 [Paenibacillus alvei]|uniref:hypothetical protein n=1 Tax=Paenibacillus alvei TaxID=44250 RepID=UPI000287CEB8|nr:hypothetical protein [Paenibacillus alvei]EJW14843.1 hypothetical protein PAV_11c01840 [Paenibacillus alvei DSM 29]MCY9543709.1 hypothetical protein [Paenibacillus alvei]MCY9708547.1 hypothetical protein [Paenibacillus alvei]MEC0083248.1 hypothetical protein [Paenibacillus alvei]